MRDLDVLIIGGGFAGLLTAIHLQDLRVAIVHPDLLGDSTSSIRAKGGMAAAVSADDSAEYHTHDTLRAGAGHGDPEVVREITSRGLLAAQKLAGYGVPFELDQDGGFMLKHEAAHSMPRILSASDSRTGRAIMRTLVAGIDESDVSTLEGWTATRLLSFDGQVRGAVFESCGTALSLQARAVVLATGGACGLWKTRSTPGAACGEGIAMAHDVGARVRDLEFVQFHPTAAEVEGEVVLLTEALRGAGAVLVDRRGNRIMDGVHDDLDLAPRDVVARRVHELRSQGSDVFLDVGDVEELSRRFPDAYRLASHQESSKISVRPCAHYHMGGVATDLEGKTNIEGLWAVGEVANTGFHGANRLASNSLLEIAVTAPSAAASIRRCLMARPQTFRRRSTGPLFRDPEGPPRDANLDRVRSWMDQHLGVRRSAAGVRMVLERLSTLPRTRAVGAAMLIAEAALRRDASLGAHFIV